MTTFRCPSCGWDGTEPIITGTILIMPPPPYAVCPKCREPVRQWSYDDYIEAAGFHVKGPDE